MLTSLRHADLNIQRQKELFWPLAESGPRLSPCNVTARSDAGQRAAPRPAPNPALEPGRLLAHPHDHKGRIALPAFYDDVEEISPAAVPNWQRSPSTSRTGWIAPHTRSAGGEEGYTVLERPWERPALEVIALVAGDPVGVARGAIHGLC
jgi:hypothetical protein